MKYSKVPLDSREYTEIAGNYYATYAELAELKFEKRHIALCACVSAQRKNPVFFTAQSACAILGIDILGDFEPHVDCISETNRCADGHITHWHYGPHPVKLINAHGMQSVTPVHAICDMAGNVSPESLLVSLNSSLYQHLFTIKQLEAEISRRTKMNGKSCLERLIIFASDKCESPLETMGWIILYKAQFAMPTQQFKITGRNRFCAFADMYWEVKGRKIILELDGRGKYTNYKNEKDENDAYFEEKVREDKLREMGYEFIRVIPREVHNGELLRKVSAKNIPKRRNFGLLFPT